MNDNEIEFLEKKWRIIDLSKKLIPGEVIGPLGKKRKLEIRSFIFPPGEIMHYIDMENHIGTHVECPSHYIDARYKEKHGYDISEIPINTFIGEAILINLKSLTASKPVTPSILENEGVHKGDIVIIGNSSFKGTDRPYIPADTPKWLAETDVKMVGFDSTLFIEDPNEFDPSTKVGKSLESYATHDYLLTHNIPFLEEMTNLNVLKKKRFYFLALPVSIKGVDSFPVRAIALEKID